jgi:hypothetical protein
MECSLYHSSHIYECYVSLVFCLILSLVCLLHDHNWFLFQYITRAVIAQAVQRRATGWTFGVLGFDSRWGLGIFPFITASRTALRPTQPPIQWVPGALSLRVKRPGREVGHLPPSSAEVKNAWSYTSTPRYVFKA